MNDALNSGTGFAGSPSVKDENGLAHQFGLTRYYQSCEELVPQLAEEFTTIIEECNEIIHQLDDEKVLLQE